MTTALASSQTREGNGSMDEIERLKVRLGERVKERNELAVEYNKLMDEYQDVVDHNNATVDLIRKKNQRIKQLKEETVQDAKSYKDEIEGLEEELEDLKKSHKSKVETKSQTIRDMVEERKDLQITLSKKNQQVEKVRELLDDRNFEAKKSIATTTRLDKQIGDETFRKAMDSIFERFRDCFMSIRRKHPFDVKTHLLDDALEQFLAKSVPKYKDNTSEEKLHVCVSLVSIVLTQFVNKKFVFGLPNKEPILSAWHTWQDLKEGAITPKSQREIKRWLALTSNILTDNHRELMIQAREESLELILEEMKKNLEAATTLQFTDALRRRLSDTISPHLITLRMLHFQDWEFRFDMVSASRKGDAVRFSRVSMEGLFWEETGFVQASLFPQLCRLEEGNEDGDNNYTVVCKARVAVTTTVEEEMEDLGEHSADSDDEEMESADETRGDSENESESKEKKREEDTSQTVLDSFDKEDEMNLDT
ncbi:hypothetical protein D6D12_10712 [Aureobasidium pullulans]|uniref:Uncharacterized protein n=1 Tax=Aureobasidium pullulans TaxID=5580 RepID=A0AB74JD00_AURPU|nr:hypothetical protein D6D12_10712 [Aureobasidium pullulans]